MIGRHRVVLVTMRLQLSFQSRYLSTIQRSGRPVDCVNEQLHGQFRASDNIRHVFISDFVA